MGRGGERGERRGNIEVGEEILLAFFFLFVFLGGVEGEGVEKGGGEGGG